MSAGPASHRVTNDLVVALLRQAGKLEGDILGMGAGSGYLTGLLAQARGKGSTGLAACDIDAAPFSARDVPFTRCNVDEGLPYPDSSFDAVVAIEVMEHTRSSYRVLGRNRARPFLGAECWAHAFAALVCRERALPHVSEPEHETGKCRASLRTCCAPRVAVLELRAAICGLLGNFLEARPH